MNPIFTHVQFLQHLNDVSHEALGSTDVKISDFEVFSDNVLDFVHLHPPLVDYGVLEVVLLRAVFAVEADGGHVGRVGNLIHVAGHGVVLGVVGAVDEVYFAVGGGRRLEHADHGGEADTAAHEDDRVGAVHQVEAAARNPNL